jgi:hypothetical protein
VRRAAPAARGAGRTTVLRGLAVVVLLLVFRALVTPEPATLRAQDAPAPARSAPAHCERASEGGPWPEIGEALEGEPSPVTRTDARRLVRAFRQRWAHVRHPSAVLRAFTECMNASDQDFVVWRVPRELAIRTLEGPGERLAGDPAAVPETPWLWHVYWGGGSRRFPPSGPVSAFFSPDLRTFVGALQHLEG